MARSFNPCPRRYTELCNRIGSPGLGPPHAPTPNVDPLEDYWEDSSVSLRSCHSWEAPSSPWLDSSDPPLSPGEQSDAGKGSHGLPPPRIRPCRYSFDLSNDGFGSSKGRRSFPPPLASCSTLSIKEGGRFVLKEMDEDRPQGFFQVQRGNGRLLLRLVLPDDLSEDAATASSSDGDDEEGYYKDDGGKDENDLSVMGSGDVGGSGISKERSDVGSKASSEDVSECNQQGDTAIKQGVVVQRDGLEVSNDSNCICQRVADEGASSAAVRSPARSDLYQDGSKAVVTSACGQDAIEEGELGLSKQSQGLDIDSVNRQSPLAEMHLDGSLSVELCGIRRSSGDDSHHEEMDCLRRFNQSNNVGDSGCIEEGKDVPVMCLSGPMWSVDVANHGIIDLSVWSPTQCLHQPIVNMRPALGLAI